MDVAIFPSHFRIRRVAPRPTFKTTRFAYETVGTVVVINGFAGALPVMVYLVKVEHI